MKLVVYWIPANGACSRSRHRTPEEMRVDVLTTQQPFIVSSDYIIGESRGPS